MSAYTARHARQEKISEYSFGDCEDRAIAASDREAEIWSDAEQLSDVLNMVRGPLDFSATAPERQQGREAMELLQRAYRTKSEDERRALIGEFGKKVYHDLIDFVEAQAAQA